MVILSDTFTPNLHRASKILDDALRNPELLHIVTKTTRAGYTTNAGMAALIANKTILIVEPTNKIAHDTIKKIMDLYIERTGDTIKTIRHIPNNRNGCSLIQRKLAKNQELENIFPYYLSGKCDECKVPPFQEFPDNNKSTPDNCIIKNLIEENIKPDIITVTYDKLNVINESKTNPKNEEFIELIESADIVLFDEVTEYIKKGYHNCNIFHNEKINSMTVQNVDINNTISELENLIYNYFPQFKEQFRNIENNYITPFMIEIVNPIVKNQIVKNQIVKNQLDKDKKIIEEFVYPRNIFNPLSFQKVNVKFKGNEISVTKTEHLKNLSMHFQESLEFMILNPPEFYHRNFKKDMKKYIDVFISLMAVMCDSNIIADKKTTQINEKHTTTDILKINLYRDKSNIISDIDRFLLPRQTSFVTDATLLENFDFKKLCKQSKYHKFGDPLKTNEKLTVMSGIETTFSTKRWYRNSEYQTSIIEHIEEIINICGAERVLIWTLNKKIHNQVIELLHNRNINASSHTDIENTNNVMVTYYNSTLTRGVESDRRIQILIGKANKPINSYSSLIYPNMDAFKLTEQIQKQFASVHNYDEILNQFVKHRKYISKMNYFNRYEENNIMNNDIKPELLPYFHKLSEQIQTEIVLNDSWQAGSRAKDPAGIEKSALLCIGWKAQDVNDMITQRDIISPKHINYSPEKLKQWMNGENFKNEFNKKTDFLGNIISFMFQQIRSSIELAVYIGTDYNDGYIVASIRLLEKANYLSTTEISPCSFNFTFSEKPFKPFPHLDLILEILRAAYEIDKNRVTYRDITRKIYIDNDDKKNDLLEALKAIEDLNLLDKSTWHIEHSIKSEYPIIVKTQSSN